MYNSYVLRRGKNGTYVLDVIRPEEAIYFISCRGYGKVYDFAVTEYGSLKERITNVFSTLNEMEREVLLYRFGFYGRFYTLNEVAKKLSRTRSRIGQIEHKAVRKLYYPNRSRKIVIKHYEMFDIKLHSKDFENVVFENIIIDEISNYLLSNNDKHTFFEEFLSKNNISLEFSSSEFSELKYNEKHIRIENAEYTVNVRVLDIPIEDLDLSVRAYNTLNRNGIKTLSELVNMTEKELMKMHCLGKKSYDEVLEKLQSLGLSLDEDWKVFTNKFITIKIIQNNNKVIFKTDITSIRKIAESLYEILVKECSENGIVLNYNFSTVKSFSTELSTFLLHKGYFSAELIADEYEKICLELKQEGYESYANEVKWFGELKKIYCEVQRKEVVRVIKLDSKIARKIINVKPNNLDELLMCCDSDDIEQSIFYKSLFLEEFIENYNLNFAERLDNISNEEIQDYDEEELIIESENDAFESDDFEDGNEFEFDFDDDLFDFGDDVEDE